MDFFGLFRTDMQYVAINETVPSCQAIVLGACILEASFGGPIKRALQMILKGEYLVGGREAVGGRLVDCT